MSKLSTFAARWSRWIMIVLLLIFWWRLLDTAAKKSVTFDEVLHIFQGALYWGNGRLYSVVQNPPLINSLIGIPVSLTAAPVYSELAPIADWLKVSKAFMWTLNDNGLEMIFAGRLAIMSLALMLAALLFRWGKQLFQSALAGLFAALLFTFDPNVLAHSFIATTDVATAFFIFLAAYTVWQFWRRPRFSWGWYVAAGAAIGLAFAAKFSGIVLIPALILMGIYRVLTSSQAEKEDSRYAWGGTAVHILGWLLIATFLFFLLYRFEWQTFWLDFSWQRGHQLQGHPSFLLGKLQEGTPLYFPIVFAVKTPLSLLLLLLFGLVTFMARRQFSWQWLWPLLLAGGIGAAALVSKVNIGYRYVLPALPFLFLMMGHLVDGRWRLNRGRNAARIGLGIPVVLTLAYVGSSLLAHPHYLAYFNAIGGGSENGWKILADSNVDWGQDLWALATYVNENNVDDLKANWLGSAPLAAYGIQGETLLGSLAAKDADDALFYDWFYPRNPQPGTYALSVTQLHGLYLQSRKDRFQWFMAQTPAARAGYSIFIYEVAPTGPAVGLALSGLSMDTLALAQYDVMHSNDVQPRWFDAAHSFLWPGGNSETTWTAVGDGHLPTHPLLTQFYPPEGPVLSGENEGGEQRWRYQFYQWPASPVTAVLNTSMASTDLGWSAEAVVGAADWEEKRQVLAGTAVFDDTLELLGYQIDPDTADGILSLLSLWRVQQTPAADLKIFVHLLDKNGQIIAQHDGLDVRLAALQPGDEFGQLHTLSLPADLPPGSYVLQIGLYRVMDQVRLPIQGTPADRILLQRLQLD